MPSSKKRRRGSTSRSPSTWLALMAALWMVACSGKTKQAGGLEVILETDMPTPASFDAVHVVIDELGADAGWAGVVDRTYIIPNDFTLPTTITLLAGRTPNQEVLITVQPLLNGQVVVERVLQAQVPASSVGEVIVDLSSKCLNILSCPVMGDSCQPDLGACGPGSTAPVVAFTPGVLLDAGVPSTLSDAGQAEAAPNEAPDSGVGEAGQASGGEAGDASTGGADDAAIPESEAATGGSDGALADPCATNNGGCSPNATCAMTGPGTNSCTCNGGYNGNGMVCTGIQSCATNNGGCAATAKCTSTGANTNTCACNTGYSGNGTTCTPINSCATGNGGCDTHAMCTTSGPGTNTCTCNAGYSGTGAACTAVNSCATNNGGCSSSATCTVTGPGTNSCMCAAGFTGDGGSCSPILVVTGGSIVATKGVLMSGVVAMVTDENTGDAASILTASIAWGDGQTSASVPLVGSNGAFTVSSSHVYAATGSPSVVVTVTDSSSGATASATFPATVRPISIVTEFMVPNSPYLGGITSFNGALWFADQGDHAIDVATTSGSVTEYPVRGTSDAPLAVAVGVNNDLWFTDADDNYVADMNTAGTVLSENSPASSGSFPFDLAPGSDGNMWMVEEAGGNVASIVPSSFAIAEYHVAGSSPYGIAAASDGNLWFTDTGNNAIGVINPITHAIQSFAIPTPSSGPDGICSGPDGNIWFVEINSNNIGRINLSTHVITQFAIPTATASPFGIANGPDGNLWFTENGVSKIGRVTTTGAFTEFPVPTFGSNVFGITAGPDGNVWFTEQSGGTNGGQVCRITP